MTLGPSRLPLPPSFHVTDSLSPKDGSGVGVDLSLSLKKHILSFTELSIKETETITRSFIGVTEILIVGVKCLRLYLNPGGPSTETLPQTRRPSQDPKWWTPSLPSSVPSVSLLPRLHVWVVEVGSGPRDVGFRGNLNRIQPVVSTRRHWDRGRQGPLPDGVTCSVDRRRHRRGPPWVSTFIRRSSWGVSTLWFGKELPTRPTV